MGNRRIEHEVREEFLELVCLGMPLRTAAGLLGVARWTGTLWWQASVSVSMQGGRNGGLAGSAPLRVVGDPDRWGRQRRSLTSEDRAVIAAGLDAGWSYGRIGRAIGRDRSVVCREVARNRGPDGSYWGPVAHRAAHERRRRPKTFRLVEDPGLCRRIEDWMDQGWSPRLIARVLQEESPRMIMGRVSHETIYQALYVQTRGSLRKDLYRQLWKSVV